MFSVREDEASRSGEGNSVSRKPAQDFSWQALRSPWAWLPFCLFLGFFFPNTRVDWLQAHMEIGRWVILFIITGIACLHWLFSRSMFGFPTRAGNPTKWELFLFLSYLWMGTSIIESVNPWLAFFKWIVFLIFLIVCVSYSTLLTRREELVLSLFPFTIFFVLFIWIIPISVPFFPQPIRGSMGHINGFLIFAPALGHFLAAFGIPITLYWLNRPVGKKTRFFLLLTLLLALGLTIKSGSRVAVISASLFLFVALARWRRSEDFDFLKVVLVCAGLLAFLTMPVIEDRIKLYLYKYPGEEELLASRTDFWDRTIEEFKTRSLFGYGFGVQKQMEGMPVHFSTIGQREQGSTFLALLEEVGVCGALPIFIFFSIIGYTSLVALWRARDPLDLFFSRVVFVGLSLAAFENYLLSLGNATSILVVFSFFCKERLAEISRMETSPGNTGEACASDIPAAPCPKDPSGAGRRSVSSVDWRPSSSSSSLDIP